MPLGARTFLECGIPRSAIGRIHDLNPQHYLARHALSEQMSERCFSRDTGDLHRVKVGAGKELSRLDRGNRIRQGVHAYDRHRPTGGTERTSTARTRTTAMGAASAIRIPIFPNILTG